MITSESNSQIKDIIKLQKNTKHRKKASAFIAEGVKLLLEAATHNKIKKIYVSESLYNGNAKEGVDLSSDIKILLSKNPYEIVSDDIFRKVSDTVTTQGILGIVSLPEYRIEDIISDKRHMWLLLDDLRDPGNLGTIIRTAEGAGMSGVIMSKGTVDLFNPKTVRATMGAIFRVPYVYVEDILSAIDKIKKAGYSVYGTAMYGSILYDKADYTKGAGIVIGNEANGISDRVFDNMTDSICIPMEGELESLNAAVSAAIVMYEAARQHRIRLQICHK